ncbi:glycosyltransferase family 2 protein [Empedobacter brevis]|uniref:Glycosyl transferase n=1 Tax=Empedobacter brevis NBRC 14943 = ATCC 43319 TaxID=1218108 RepID=A0A511NKW7_9FLAO|nr:glycosyltransferase [Empedobacter brevis]GEM53434.1 glycosyl transferase [Empedobacter brevis NBRC 14943 = ATCC 43319]
MDNCEISVIVAIYNAEEFLEKCLDSIKEQTFKNFEVILINDGSLDSSAEICNSYVKDDNRFKVFHIANEGVGNARNLGIKSALGKYIIHVDADDYVESEYLEILYNEIEAKQFDMVFCNFNRLYDDNKLVIENIEGCYSPIDLIKEILLGNQLGVLWNKLMRTDILKKYGLNVQNQINMCEDLHLTIRYLLKSSNIHFVNKPLYNYRYNIHSYSYNRNSNSFVSMFWVVSSLETELSEYKSFLTEYKLQLRRDLVLFGDRKEFKNIYPETYDYVIRSKVLTNFQKVLLLLEQKQIYFFVTFLLYVRKLMKKFNYFFSK